MANSYIDEDGDEILVDDQGQPLGYIAQAADGAMVLVNGDQILAAATPDGQVLDHTQYQVDVDDGTNQQGDHLDARIAQLEAQQQQAATFAEQFNIASAYETAQAQREADEAQLRDIGMQLEHVEGQLGRQLTTREVRQVSEQLRNDLDAGRGLDLPQAIHRLHSYGDIHDVDTPQGRVAFATERMAEVNNQRAGREPDDNGRHAEHYDINDHQGRVDYALDRMAGHDDAPSRAYDSRDLDE
jgi:hypothetical protein